MADITRIREAFVQGHYLFTEHGSSRAAKRAIRSYEINQAIENAEVIEDYPDDKYGPSCLLLGFSETNLALHIQVSYPPLVRIITVYEPDLAFWEADLRTRKTP